MDQLCWPKNGQFSSWPTKWVHEVPNPCFLCTWNNRAKKQALESKTLARTFKPLSRHCECNKRVFSFQGENYIPSLAHKIRTDEAVYQSLEKDGNCFKNICSQFPGLSNAKLTAGILDRPQIRMLMRDSNFSTILMRMSYMSGTLWKML